MRRAWIGNTCMTRTCKYFIHNKKSPSIPYFNKSPSIPYINSTNSNNNPSNPFTIIFFFPLASSPSTTIKIPLYVWCLVGDITKWRWQNKVRRRTDRASEKEKERKCVKQCYTCGYCSTKKTYTHTVNANPARYLGTFTEKYYFGNNGSRKVSNRAISLTFITESCYLFYFLN